MLSSARLTLASLAEFPGLARKNPRRTFSLGGALARQFQVENSGAAAAFTATGPA